MNVTIQALELSNLVQIGEDELLLNDLDLVELVVNIVSFLQLEKPVVGAQHPSMRTMLQMTYSSLADYLRQPAELAAVADRARGIIWAASNHLTGKVEFQVLDLDEANEVTGSRVFAVEPAMGATWLKSMLGAAAPKLPFDQLIEIRESLSDVIQSRISGDAPVERPNSFIMNCFAFIAERNKAPVLETEIPAASDDAYDRLRRFCHQHPKMNLAPDKLLKVGIEFETSRVATGNMVVKLSNDLLNSLNTQTFAVNARGYHDVEAALPTRRTIAALSNRSSQLFRQALDAIETQVKARLMAETMLNIKIARIDNDHTADQIVELVLAIAQGQVDTQSMFTLDDKAIKSIRFCADEWWRLMVTETLHDNGLIAVVTSGKDAGRARQFDGTQRFWYPIRQRQLR